MRAPLFSVVIPAYNAAAFIEKTLDSVRAQTLQDYEIIVVDDGSRDDTKGVVDRWLARHSQPGRCIRQENKKIAGARNTGIRAAAADHIALLDHDDLWYPEKLAAVAAAFRADPDTVLVCHDMNIVQDGRRPRTARMGPAAPRMYERLLFEGNALAPSTSVFRKDKALEIGGFRENPEFDTSEDYDFWMRLSRIGSFHFIDQVLTEYHEVENSASSRVEYHLGNAEAVLRDHFASYFRGDPGIRGRFLMRRRMATLYRAWVVALGAAGASREKQREYVRRMIVTYPFSPRNLARLCLWLIGR
ncbi:MAG: glycosyltransferase family A protein [Elusimicrobia bacterium]|nr:glycosyltransferase family A protein [Elusimicrobiota bacterium]